MSFYVIIRGPLGCGKTTVAKKLAEKIGAAYISIDEIVDDPNLVTVQKENGYISQKSFIAANKIASKKAKKYLAEGIPVIFDGNFYWRSQIEDLLAQVQSPHYVFTLTAPIEVCIERDAKRKKSLGEKAVREVYTKSTEFQYGTKIDVTKEDCVSDIMDQIPM